MTVERKEIRNTATELLRGATLAGDNVFASRVVPNRYEDLPVINVYTASEAGEESSKGPLSHKRTIELICEIITADGIQDSNATDLCDDIAEEIEQIIFREDANKNGKLGCLVNSITFGGMTYEYESNGEGVVNNLRLSFNVEYYKDAVTGFAENTIDLDRMGVDWDVGTASDPDPEASDLIELGP